jgi:hypothetical protein
MINLILKAWASDSTQKQIIFMVCHAKAQSCLNQYWLIIIALLWVLSGLA